MAATVFHGTVVSNLRHFIGKGDIKLGRSFLGLFVTDTYEHASRYANAQASHTVSHEYTALSHGAAVVEVASPEPVKWLRRSEGHSTLDVCEDTIKRGHVVSVSVGECDYLPCTCHKSIADFRRAMPHVAVEATVVQHD